MEEERFGEAAELAIELRRPQGLPHGLPCTANGPTFHVPSGVAFVPPNAFTSCSSPRTSGSGFGFRVGV